MAKKVIIGDIWKQKGFKVVSTNLGGVHGRGLAAQAKQQGKITASNVSFATSPKNSDVITLAVKGNAPETAKVRGRAYSEKTTGKNVELLKSEVKQLIQFARKNPTKNVNLPFIGLGFGEGNPDEILPILREAEKEPNIFLVSKDEGTVKRYQSTFRAGVRTDKSIRNLSKAIKSRVSNQSSSSSPPSNAKTIYFQGPSSGISDPEAFKKALTKRYSEAKKKHGDVQVQFRGSSTSQADQLIGEWANEGFRKYRHAKQLHTGFKSMSSAISSGSGPKVFKDEIIRPKQQGSPQLFRTNERGMPIIDKEPINISKINAPGESVEKISFSSKGKIVYPGKDTKQHHKRFLELTGSPKQGGLGLKKGFEAYLDELEDIGRGSTKQALDKPRTLSIKGKKVTRLPMLGQGQGQVTKVKANVKSMLAGLQVAEDKAKYYSLDQPTLDRISNLKKDVPYPLGAEEYVGSEDVDNPEQQSVVTWDDPDTVPKQPKVKKSALTDAKFRAALKSQVSKSDELKPDVQEDLESDEVLQLTKINEEDISTEDKAIRKEGFKLEKLENIKRVSGSEAWKKWVKSPASRRIIMGVLGDVFKIDTTLGVTSSDVSKKKEQITKVISGPHKKGKLISAKQVHWTEKKYIERDTQLDKYRKKPEVEVRKEISQDQKARIGEKISRLRTSGDRSLASIKAYIAQSTAPPKPSEVKLLTKTYTDPKHPKWLKKTAPLQPFTKTEIKKVTASITKYHKPVTEKAGIKAIEDKLKVTAKKKALPVNKELTSNVTKELQKQFHGKDKPRYKTTVGKGLKFTRGIGAFSLFSSIFGVARARKEAKQEFGKIGIKRDPTALETLSFTLPKFARPKLYRKIPDA